MCNHVFVYPQDRPWNYNDKSGTLTGVCRNCGAKNESYGIKRVIRLEEEYFKNVPYGESLFLYIDKNKSMC